jgi:GNAT superfamily N-acetyltransferase
MALARFFVLLWLPDDEQGRGLGKQLTENRLRWAAEYGIGTRYVLTATARDYWCRFR